MSRVVILLACILFSTCVSTHQKELLLKQGDWKLQLLNGSKVPTLAKPITLRFDTSDLDPTAGLASGFSGCNQYSVGYRQHELALTFTEELASTKMFCEVTMNTETTFLTALQQVQSFKRKGNTLLLLAADGKVILEFEK